MAKSTSLNINDILAEAGEVGRLLHKMGASEGGAGNLSVCVREPLDVQHLFPLREEIRLPLETPRLAGMMLIASGSGCRLRDIEKHPTANMGCLVVNKDGKTGQLFTAADRQFTKLTSEFNTHLAAHHHEMSAGNLNFHAVLHAQPPHITYLSHIERYQDQEYFNRQLFRWEPETIFQFPQGLGMTRYQIPGSPEIEAVTSESMKQHTLVVWAKHGVITRSEISLMQAFDRIEYAEAAAHFEYLNLSLGEPSNGLSAQELLDICERYNVQQEIF
jgi:rhamnulose-1-phosphate aldolase